jgi:hypothetical protein
MLTSSETWEVGSHRNVDRVLPDGQQFTLCEIYGGALDSLEQADAVQRLVAAAPDLMRALRLMLAQGESDGSPAMASSALNRALGVRR